MIICCTEITLLHTKYSVSNEICKSIEYIIKIQQIESNTTLVNTHLCISVLAISLKVTDQNIPTKLWTSLIIFFLKEGQTLCLVFPTRNSFLSTKLSLDYMEGMWPTVGLSGFNNGSWDTWGRWIFWWRRLGS